MKHPPRVLFLGMQGNFSLPPLHTLLQNGIDVCAVVIPAADGPDRDPLPIKRKERPPLVRPLLPMLKSSLQNNIVQLAWQRQIPVWEVTGMADRSVVAALAAYQPDVICVACFSLRIPRVILDVPRLGCLNVHPSLLPANRGPEPLFWAFRQGLHKTGVSIHFMHEGMDTGDILAQESIEIPAGMSYAALEYECALRGGELLTQSVQALCMGNAIATPQDEKLSSYQSFPTPEDFIVPVAEWSAEHVYRFVCGVAGWREPIKLQLGHNKYVYVQKATSYSHEDTGTLPGEVYSRYGDTLRVKCKKGWVGVVNPTASQ
ncbi:MAG: methionyl-tRNA formyltransferase [Ktedonobacteraceae bacterium]